MKKSKKITVAVLAVILVMLTALSCVPISLLSVIGVPEGEDWVCHILPMESEMFELDAGKTEVLVRRMEHVNVRFRGWTEDYFTDGWAYLHHVDAASGKRIDTIRVYLDEQGLLWVDDLKFALVGEDGDAFAEALAAAIAGE